MPTPYFTQFRLNNEIIDSPIERNEVSIEVNFEDNVQGNIETTNFTFVNEAYTIIQNWIDGNVGIFEGIPLEVSIQEGQENTNVFQGFLDMKTIEDLTNFEPKVLASIIKEDGLNNLNERLQGLTFALLEANGTIKKSDYENVKAIIEKKVTFIEQALLALSIYLLLKEIYEATYRINQRILTITDILISGLTGQVRAIIYAGASLLIEAAYVALMLTALIGLVESFFTNIIPQTKDLKGLKLRTGLTKIFTYLGYQFTSPIKELDEYVYMPSKADGRQNKGVPFDSDYGFTASEFVELCITMFKAKLFVKDGIVQLRSEKDVFFKQQSTYILPDVLETPFTYNTSELKESILISFQDDLTDEYTVDNWKGTSYVVTTKPNTVNNQKAVQINGFNEVRIPISLGNRKNSLSLLEKALNEFIKVANALFSVFGGGNTFTELTEKIGLLKLSSPFFNNPKILKVKSEKLPTDYRDSLSAKYLWNNYINYDSFVNNNFERQRKVYTAVRIPFSFLDYKKLTENSYFTTADGKQGKITALKWVIDSDTAEISYYIEEIYTRNLREEYYEVE